MRWWRRNTPDDTVRLMPIGMALLLTLALAASTVVLLGVATVAVLGVPRPDPRGPTVAELLEALKIALALVAGVGVVVALVVAYRRQRVLEEENSRAREAAAVRIAGIYAVANLADDAPTRELRQACIDVLCAYVRMPYQHDPQGAGWREGEKTVRDSIIDLVRDHLRGSANRSWIGHNFDFSGAIFDGFVLSNIEVSVNTFLSKRRRGWNSTQFLRRKRRVHQRLLHPGTSQLQRRFL